MSELKIVGDLIQFDGYDIGRVSDTGIPASMMDKFVQALDGRTMDQDENAAIEAFDEALALLVTRAEDNAKAGLVTIKELKAWVELIKSEQQRAPK